MPWEALGDDAQRQCSVPFAGDSPASEGTRLRPFQDVVQELAFSGPAIAPPASLKARSWRELHRNRRSRLETGFSCQKPGRVAGIGTGSLDEGAVSRCRRCTHDHVTQVGARW